MYHSVNMSYVLISTDGESEDLKPMEKALRSEEVTIILSSVSYFRQLGYMRYLMVLALVLRGFLCYLTGRIASLMEPVVNTQLNFGHGFSSRALAASRSGKYTAKGS